MQPKSDEPEEKSNVLYLPIPVERVRPARHERWKQRKRILLWFALAAIAVGAVLWWK